jgi:asparagine synthase (glutamine-hydrolysing)
MGFSVPLASWFRGPLRERVRTAVLDENNPVAQYFRPEKLKQLVEQHESGRRDNSEYLWALLMFATTLNKLAS